LNTEPLACEVKRSWKVDKLEPVPLHGGPVGSSDEPPGAIDRALCMPSRE